jgi:two-component system cell cycle sensor histidine kinase/response regulator CckA
VPTGNPSEEIVIAENHTAEIHLLLTDVLLPERSRRDLRGRLGALRPGMKCRFMSGCTATIISHSGVLEKGINFISKPFSRATAMKHTPGATGCRIPQRSSRITARGRAGSRT